MGLADLGDKISEFRGIKHLLKSSRGHHEAIDGGGIVHESDRGIAGGPQRSRGRVGNSAGPWMKLDDDAEGSHRMLYIVRGCQVSRSHAGGQL